MSFERNLYYSPFLREDLTHWKCPTCFLGILSIKEIKKHELQSSIKMGSRLLYTEDRHGSFQAELICSNSKCSESVTLAGRVVDKFKWNKKKSFCEHIEHYYPEYFYPYIKLFQYPENISYEIEEQLNNVFKVFWIDSSACANAIRTLVEEILTDKKIRKTQSIPIKDKTTTKRKKYSLHKRIELFEQINPQVAKHLLAIKWIGNDGSHSYELDDEILVDGIELLEHVFEKLYSDKEKRLNSMAKEINKKKG